jgi:5-(carboxyamino)imidazole ribonucleotide synthase
LRIPKRPFEHRLDALRSLPDTHVDWYGKSPETAGRKLGHVTVLLAGPSADRRACQAEQALKSIRSIWPTQG